MPDLIADTPEQYVKIALYLTEAVRRIPELRSNVRRAVVSSPLMDDTGMARALETAYRDMWERWCASPA